MADGRILIDTELNDKGLEKGLQSLQGKLETTGKSLQTVGGNLTKKFTVPLTAAAGFAVKLGMDFESAMARVAAVSGATADEMEALEGQARELGSTTKFSAQQAADGMEFLARAGFDANEVMAAMPGLLDLAAASGADLGAAADITSNILSGFGMEAAEAGRVADVLAHATANSNTTVESMGEAMKYVAPVAASLGISVEEAASAVGILGDAGIAGGQAGTVLRRGLLSLASPTASTANLMEELGLEMFDAEGNMKSLPEVIAQLETGLEGMTSQQKTATLETLFGQQAVSGFSALLEAGSDSLGGFTDNLYDSEGAAADMAATMNDTTMGRLLELKSAIEEVGLQLYEALQPAIEMIIGKLTDLASWFNGLSDEQVKTIATIGALVAVIGPLLAILGTIIVVVSKVIGVFAAVNPIVLIVVGVIAGLIAIGVALAQNWDTIKAKAIEVFSSFSPLLEVVRAAFQKLMDSVGPIIESLKSLWESLIPIFQLVGTIIGSVLAVAFGLLTGVINGAIAAIGPLINALINLVSFVTNMVSVVVALLTGDFAGAWEYLKAAGQSVVDFFISAFEGLINFIMGFVDGVIGFFQGLYDVLVGNSIIPDMVEAIVEWFQNMFQWVIDIVMNIVNGVITAFTNIYNTVSSLVQAVWNVISSIWNAILGFISGVLSGIFGTVSNIFNSIRNTISSVMSAVRSVISSIWNGIRSTVSSVLNGIRSTITSVWNGIRSTISSVLNGIRSTVSSIWNGIRSTISNVTNSIKSTISNIFNSLRGIVSNAFSSVRSAVSSGMSSALGAVTSMLGNFTNAGGNIVRNIASGIRGAIGSVTSAISSVTQKIRNFLPFSPAKEGPLTDINKLDFDGPIGDSLDDAIPSVQSKLNAMLQVPTMQPAIPGGHGFNTPMQRPEDNSRPVHIETVLVVDGDELARATIDPIDTSLSDRVSIEAYLRGDR